MANERSIKSGSMQGGSVGSKIHPDAPHDAHAKMQTSIVERALREEEQARKIPMATAIIERGHTVECAVPGERNFVGYTTDEHGNSRTVYGPVYTKYGPGSEVTLPLSEINRLRELGFLVDPKKTYKTHRDIARAQSSIATEARARATYTDTGGAHVST
jgi:hypothetical protein